MLLTSERFYDTLVIGTGCSGYNAADWLYDLGRDVAILTEGVQMGTSRNTGSDKQTYYKLSLASGEGDSVREMAETLFSGGGVHGDTALIEAACSVKAFMKLVLLGVPFPTNAYGEYVGYKTDHDPRQRATSCGPLTSKLMTEALERSVRAKGVPVFENTQAVRLLTENHAITGVLALDTITGEHRVFACNHVVLATGGPAGIYRDSVYPESQTGALGLAVNAGAATANLCEWQYGLASTKFRWNVSGTYQQVLPKYMSAAPDGTEREFLPERFSSPAEALNMGFLKGYQWPFDVRKAKGSSRVDLFVHEETLRGHRVYMDFRFNPTDYRLDTLSNEARDYLTNSDAAFGTPIERLEKMNSQAVKLYRDNGINLYGEPLEIAVCAQHCNGGVAVDVNWESSVKGLYAVGEAAGTFGVYRPGGSALNSTQVGSMRAAEHIARKKNAPAKQVSAEITAVLQGGAFDADGILDRTRRLMSQYAAFRREPAQMKALYEDVSAVRDTFWQKAAVRSQSELPQIYKCFDTLTAQAAVLSAMLFAAEEYGSRGSCLVEGSPKTSESAADTVVITQNLVSRAEQIRPLPEGGGWFETVWNEYNRRNAW
ncbi:MAG: FAD-binding protein [Oscillospiraceae bacterium]|nr:FAD-binding protein [Oscillospiraceae bacterium]